MASESEKSPNKKSKNSQASAASIPSPSSHPEKIDPSPTANEEYPGRITKVIRGEKRKTLAESLPTWALVLITLIGALLILMAIYQIGLLETGR
jgi:hypothetical protein